MALQPAVFAHKFRVRPSSPVAEASPPGIEIFRTLLVPSAAEASGGEGQLNHRAKIRTLLVLSAAEASGVEGQLNHRAKIRTLLVLSAAEASGVEGPG